jgi:hypothetical protein
MTSNGYTLRCVNCKQYHPMRELKEYPDGLWRCKAKCRTQEAPKIKE